MVQVNKQLYGVYIATWQVTERQHAKIQSAREVVVMDVDYRSLIERMSYTKKEHAFCRQRTQVAANCSHPGQYDNGARVTGHAAEYQ